MASHYLEHSEHDCNVFGYSRYILARVDKGVCKAQEKEAKMHIRDFAMSSHRGTTVYNAVSASTLPDLLVFANQAQIHSAVMNQFMQGAPAITPPWSADRQGPHMFSDDPYTQFSFRIEDDYLRSFHGPVPDIMSLSSLVVRRGRIGTVPIYRV
jgi:hypothetical protein